MSGLESNSQKILYIPSIHTSSNITDITDMLDDRLSRSVYVSKSIIDEFSRYAKTTHEGVAFHMEHAFIEYMINHPTEYHKTTIQQVFLEKIENGVQRELEEKILCKNIKDCLETLDNIESTGRGNFSIVLSDLIKYVSEATKIKSPNDKLLNVLNKVKESERLE